MSIVVCEGHGDCRHSSCRKLGTKRRLKGTSESIDTHSWWCRCKLNMLGHGDPTTALCNLSLLLQHLPSNGKCFISLASRNTKVHQHPSQLSWRGNYPKKLKKLLHWRRPSRICAPEGFHWAHKSISMCYVVLSVRAHWHSHWLCFSLHFGSTPWYSQRVAHCIWAWKLSASTHNPPSPLGASKACFWFLDHGTPRMKPRDLTGILGKHRNLLLLVIFLQHPTCTGVSRWKEKAQLA